MGMKSFVLGILLSSPTFALIISKHPVDHIQGSIWAYEKTQDGPSNSIRLIVSNSAYTDQSNFSDLASLFSQPFTEVIITQRPEGQIEIIEREYDEQKGLGWNRNLRASKTLSCGEPLKPVNQICSAAIDQYVVKLNQVKAQGSDLQQISSALKDVKANGTFQSYRSSDSLSGFTSGQ